MNRSTAPIAALLLFSLTFSTVRGSSSESDTMSAASTNQESGIPLQTIIKEVAKKTGKKFVFDANIHANVELIGVEVRTVTYGELLTILQTAGFTAVESGGLTYVTAEISVRQRALPVIAGSTVYPDAQYVSKVIAVHKVPAATLIPILRPLLPQQAHLAAAACNNSIIMVDTYANIRRIEMLIASLDVGEIRTGNECDNQTKR